jgi:hypothetical protein
MNKFRLSIKLLAIAIFMFAFASMAQAQATRTWVSGVGDDANPCSRTAPCKTFAGAISKTAAGGEIDALDPGGFGAVTITKSITIDACCMAGILAAGTTGVIVNDGATATPNTIVVTLRHLSINGATSGFNGVRFIAGKSLNIENCQIFGFLSSTGTGVDVALTASGADVNISDTSIFNNLKGIRATTTAGFVTVNLDNVNISHHTTDGIKLENGGFASVQNSVITFNATGVNDTGGGNSNANLIRTEVSHNTTGLAAGSSTCRIGGSTFFANGSAITVAGGAVKSAGDNYIDGPGVAALTPMPPQ